MTDTLKIIQPSLLLDPDRCRRNIERMCHKMAEQKVIFRPHFKTHQSREIGSWFRDYGVDKITVSSLRMAQFFADDGWSDITVAFPVNLLEIERIKYLSERISLNLIAEDANVLKNLDSLLKRPAGIFLKMDVGTHRTGIGLTDMESIEMCADAMRRSKHLTWKGFVSHAGHTYQSHKDRKRIEDVYQHALHFLGPIKAHYIDEFPHLGISFGDTPGASIIDDFSGIDEMRPGNFVFYDTMQEAIGSCAMDDIAVAMLCPVVATHPDRSTCIVYGGGVHFSKDSIRNSHDGTSFGTMVRFEDGRWSAGHEIGNVTSLSQEHGVIEIRSETAPPKPGQVVSILPVHSCMTAQCMAGYITTEGHSIDHFAASPYYLH